MEITPVTHWNASTAIGAQYEKLLAAIGTPAFGGTVRETLRTATAGAQRLYLFEATSSDHSDLQYAFCEDDVRALFALYCKLYLPLDPVRDAYRATPRVSDVVLQRVRPRDIASPGFRRRFFDEPGIVERVSVVQRGSDSWRAMSVARHRSDGCFSDIEIDTIVGLACLALPMLPLNRTRSRKADRLSVEQLEERFADYCPPLTRRERQVCARAAIGMTVEATALDLGIAASSVLTYRRRAYQRLEITSPFELCALVTH
jgi:DNA-binding CsgD family transcriptional regulator